MTTKQQHQAECQAAFNKRLGEGQTLTLTKLSRDMIGLKVHDKHEHLIAGGEYHQDEKLTASILYFLNRQGTAS